MHAAAAVTVAAEVAVTVAAEVAVTVAAEVVVEVAVTEKAVEMAVEGAVKGEVEEGSATFPLALGEVFLQRIDRYPGRTYPSQKSPMSQKRPIQPNSDANTVSI